VDRPLSADGQGVGGNNRQTHTGGCVESESILSGRASNFLYSRIARNQMRCNPPSYSDNTKGMYTSKEGGDQAAATKKGARCKASLLLSPSPGVLLLADLFMNTAIPQPPYFLGPDNF
jgi:hypothetical protein